MDYLLDLELRSLKEAIDKANKILSSAYGEIIHHKSKDKGIVTKFDIYVEEQIKIILSKNLDYPFLAEETSNTKMEAPVYWIIDPIDGTTAFAHGNPMFAVSIALVKNNKIVLSAVSNPAYNETYLFNGSFTTLNDKTVSVVETKDTPIAFIDYGYSPSDEKIAAKVADILIGKVTTRHLGSTALELAYVAAGRADILISIGDEIWDYAGGLGLITGGKGKICDFKGSPLGIESKYIIAGYPNLVELITPLLSSLQP